MKQEPRSNETKASIPSNQIQHSTSYKVNKENSKNTERWSNSALPVTKPPIPAPRAINQQQDNNNEDRPNDAGKQHTSRIIF